MRLAVEVAVCCLAVAAAAGDDGSSRRTTVLPGSFSVLLENSHVGGSVGIAAIADATQAAIQTLDAIDGVNVRSAISEIGVVFVSGPSNSAAIIKKRMVGQRVKAVLPTLMLHNPVLSAVEFQSDASSGSFISSAGTLRDGNPSRMLSVDQEPDYRPLQWSRDAIDAERAFNAGLKGGGKRPARVGVLDTGFWLDHPSIAHYNKKQSFNFVAGEELLFNTALTSTDPKTQSDLSHGTHTSSILAGADLKGEGTIGIAPKADLVLIKVLPDAGPGADFGILSGIKYAAAIGLDVINLSLGSQINLDGVKVDDPKTPYDDRYSAADAAAYVDMWSRATTYAWQQGVAIIVSAGNNAFNLRTGDKNMFSIMADLPHVLAVSATGPVYWGKDQSTNLDKLAPYSNTGAAAMVSAPGGNTVVRTKDYNTICSVKLSKRATLNLPCRHFDVVLSACCSRKAVYPLRTYFLPTRYAWLAGTSMAAPHVAGVAALIVAKRGRPIKPDKLFAYLKQCTNDLGPKGKDDKFGSGRINAGKVVTLEF